MLTLVGGEHGGNDAVAVGCQLGARRFVCGGRSSVSAARQRRRTRLHHRRTDRIAHAAAAPQTLGARAWQTTRAAASARHPRMPAGEGPSMMMARHHHPVLRPPSPFSHSQKASHELVRHERCPKEREVQKKNGSGREAKSTGPGSWGAGQHVWRVGRGFQPLRADWSRLHRGGRLHARLERRLRGEGRLGVRGHRDALEAKYLLAHAAGARRCTHPPPRRRLTPGVPPAGRRSVRHAAPAARLRSA